MREHAFVEMFPPYPATREGRDELISAVVLTIFITIIAIVILSVCGYPEEGTEFPRRRIAEVGARKIEW
ncbi:hypothetical protein ZHAS_00006998 [Anopheles sinensis]|uniref:Uncharacterized protein n=1 Tax=Anopheles sinensis TaxID=74873 RepID=A0A084VNF7_ANOSI|nr:hypothetical protein ZHAS_00006998 [Anopheles sinensis]